MFSLWWNIYSKFQIERKHLHLALLFFVFLKTTTKVSDVTESTWASTQPPLGPSQECWTNGSQKHQNQLHVINDLHPGVSSPPESRGILKRSYVLQHLIIVKGVSLTYIRCDPSHVAVIKPTFLECLLASRAQPHWANGRLP